MERKFVLGWMEYTAIGLGVVVIFGVAAIISPAVRCFFESEVVAAWASALATSGATLVALWLGLHQVRQQRREQDLSAQVLRHMLAPEIHGVLTAAAALPKLLDQIAASYFAEDGGEGYSTAIRFTAARLVMPGAERSINSLTRMSRADAEAIAWLLGTTPRLRLALIDWADRYGNFSLQRHEIVREARARASEISEVIRHIKWAN